MRIGIDTTPLPQRPVGAGNYIIQLVRALLRQPGSDEFVIFAQRATAPLLGLAESPRLQLVVLPDKHPALRLLWEQTIFPILVKRYRIDLLHSLHYTFPLLYPGRRVVTLHDMTFFLFPHLHTPDKRYIFRFFIHTSARLADALVADSESTRQDAMRIARIPAKKIFTAQLGVTEEFHPIHDPAHLAEVRQKYSLPGRFVLYVGLIEPRKNLPSLLKAFSMIASRIPQHHLVITGRMGWMVADVMKQVEALDLQHRVHFTGYVEQADLPVVYNMADLSVYPSIYEGFGFPVLESMACGTPVITTNVSSMPEIIADAGIQLSPQDTAGLAQAILALIESPEQRRVLAEKGLQRAAQFTWDRTAAQTLAVYRYVLGETPGPNGASDEQ
ncbi:MAG: glycosyltransferase family 4 protein [Anaerolineales bacterium]|nr:glycosyltransferase family 4 protein [Anaerolineales bacterium]